MIIIVLIIMILTHCVVDNSICSCKFSQFVPSHSPPLCSLPAERNLVLSIRFKSNWQIRICEIIAVIENGRHAYKSGVLRRCLKLWMFKGPAVQPISMTSCFNVVSPSIHNWGLLFRTILSLFGSKLSESITIASRTSRWMVKGQM